MGTHMAHKKPKTATRERAPAQRSAAAPAREPSVRAAARVAAPRPVAASSPVHAASGVAAAVKASAPSVGGTLTLGASLSIREVGECATQLKALLAAGSVSVDAHQLESIDTAGLQLLLAAAAEARRRGLRLKLLGGENLNRGAAGALGLSEHLAAAAEILP
jgi:ABC-type transporter Mla MlaB component